MITIGCGRPSSIIALKLAFSKSKESQCFAISAGEELHNALMQEKEGRLKVIPVRIQECNLPAVISHRRYADIFGNPTIGLLDLIAVLRPDMGENGIVLALKAMVERESG